MHKFKIAIYSNKENSMITQMMEDLYSDKTTLPIEVVTVPVNASTCGCRYNVVAFEKNIDSTIRDEIAIPAACLAPKDIWEIDYLAGNKVQSYTKVQGYHRDYDNPEDRVNKWIEENM